MNNYGKISSRRDIRNKRRRRKRRNLLSKFISIGFVLILLLALTVGIVLIVKNHNEEDNKTKITAESTGTSEEEQSDDIVQQEEQEQLTDEPEQPTKEVVQVDTAHETDGMRIVCIDSGHGGEDPGAIGIDGTYEKDDVLSMAKAIRDELEALGVTVYMTRETDVTLEREDRYGLANSVNADLFLSVHRNSNGDSSVQGFETWVHSTKPKAATAAATLIQDKLCQIEGVKDRGVKFGSQSSESEDLFINNHSKGPSCLLEMGFMSNTTDNELFNAKKQEMAQAIAQAIVEWMDAQGL